MWSWDLPLPVVAQHSSNSGIVFTFSLLSPFSKLGS